MSDSNLQLQWTDEQWNKVRQVVYEEARRARVAGSFLPLYGPLEPDATYVTRESLREPNAPNDQGTPAVNGFTVDDTRVLRLSTLQVRVYLKGAQVADPELTSALIAFRRAANVVARLEDMIVFNGQRPAGQSPAVFTSFSPLTPRPQGAVAEVVGGEQTDGLLAPRGGYGLPNERTSLASPADSRYIVRPDDGETSATKGEKLVSVISKAIATLEEGHHLGPFACALGHQYFTYAQTPSEKSMVLPQDRILPFLGGGALLRTSALPKDTGLVIALSGEPIDLVVGTDISVKFLQVTTDPFFVFRVYEKIVLRIKQPDAIAVLDIPAGPVRRPRVTKTTKSDEDDQENRYQEDATSNTAPTA